MNKGYKLSGIMILIIIGCYFLIIHSLNTPPKSDSELLAYTEEKVKKYLIQEKGHSEGEILEIESTKKAKSSDSSASGYEVEVVFADEPEAIYYYQVTEAEKVEQFGVNGKAIKHKEKP